LLKRDRSLAGFLFQPLQLFHFSIKVSDRRTARAGTAPVFHQLPVLNKSKSGTLLCL